MRLYYCLACARVYYLREEAAYICSRNHVPAVWKDGRRHRYLISARADTDKPPWAVPPLVEEREVPQQDLVESWLDVCKFPSDTEYGDYRRHFGYNAFGGRHLTREDVVSKYREYVLRLTEG